MLLFSSYKCYVETVKPPRKWNNICKWRLRNTILICVCMCVCVYSQVCASRAFFFFFLVAFSKKGNGCSELSFPAKQSVRCLLLHSWVGCFRCPGWRRRVGFMEFLGHKHQNCHSLIIMKGCGTEKKRQRGTGESWGRGGKEKSRDGFWIPNCPVKFWDSNHLSFHMI